MSKQFLGVISLALAASIWGGMYIVVKVVVDTIPPIELVWIRFLIGSITLGIICLLTKQIWKIEKKYWFLLILISLIGYVISIVLQDTGTALSTAQLGSLITATTPSFMVIFARIILKEKITLKKVLSVFFASIGVIVIVGINTELNSALGIMCLVLAAITWSLMSVLVKKVPSTYSQLVVTTYTSMIAVLILSPIVVARFDSKLISSLAEPKIFFGLLYLGIISTAGGYFLWNKGLQLANVTSGGLLFFMQPVVGIFLGWLLLGEQVNINFWIGTILIFIGVLITIFEKDTTQVPSTELTLNKGL